MLASTLTRAHARIPWQPGLAQSHAVGQWSQADHSRHRLHPALEHSGAPRSDHGTVGGPSANTRAHACLWLAGYWSLWVLARLGAVVPWQPHARHASRQCVHACDEERCQHGTWLCWVGGWVGACQRTVSDHNASHTHTHTPRMVLPSVHFLQPLRQL